MYIIYKTTNKINLKFYIGIHKTNDVNDTYLGSGKRLKLAFKKYGKNNFEKEILFIFDNKHEAYLKETEIVNEEFLKRKDVYNFKKGGEGGWDHIAKLMKENENFSIKMKNSFSEGVKKAYKDGKLKGWEYVTVNGMLGKNHSKETKKLLSLNNGNKLTLNKIEERRKDYFEIEKEIGWVNKLSSKWKISHTQVNRFIKKHIGK